MDSSHDVAALARDTELRHKEFRSSPLRRIAAATTDPAARNAIFSLVDQAVVSGTNFLTTVIVGRFCGQGGLGVYILAFSIVLFARGFQQNIVCAPYMVYCHRRNRETLGAYRGSTLIQQLLLSVLSLFSLTALLAVFALGYGPSGLVPVIAVLLGAMPFLLLREYIRYFSFSHLDMRTALAIDAVVAAGQLGGLLLLGLQGSLSVPSAYVIMGAACAVACVGWVWGRPSSLRFDRSCLLSDWRQNWSFGKWALAGHLMGTFSFFLLPWLVVFTHGEMATGTLAACMTFVGLSNMFVIAMDNYFLPKSAQAYSTGGMKALRWLLNRLVWLDALVLGIFWLLVTFTGDLAVVAVYGPQYEGTELILSLLALSVLVRGVGLPANIGLWAIDRPRADFLADSATFVATVIPAVFLVPSLGVLGAALATLIGAVAGAVLARVTFSREARAIVDRATKKSWSSLPPCQSRGAEPQLTFTTTTVTSDHHVLDRQ